MNRAVADETWTQTAGYGGWSLTRKVFGIDDVKRQRPITVTAKLVRKPDGSGDCMLPCKLKCSSLSDMVPVPLLRESCAQMAVRLKW